MNAPFALGLAVANMGSIIVREWDNDRFHSRVLELESHGYIARRETYTVTPEQHPDMGYIVHLYSMEMYPDAELPAQRITCDPPA